MAALNKEIAAVEDLNENYQIGASYFLKLKTLTFDQLWTDYLEPLLQEYVQGMYDEESIMNRFAKAYGYKKPTEVDANEATENLRLRIRFCLFIIFLFLFVLLLPVPVKAKQYYIPHLDGNATV